VLSPQTTLAALDAFSDISVQDIREIARALARTAIDRAEESRRRINSLSEQVQGLGDHLMGYEDTFERASDDFQLNTNYPNLKIPISDGLWCPAKWIKPGEDGFMYAYTDRDGIYDLPYLIPIYAQPVHSSNPITALPRWFCTVLKGPSAHFNSFITHAKDLNDWGIAANCTHYQKLEDEAYAIDCQMHRLEEERLSIEHKRDMCVARLEAARASESLNFLEGYSSHIERHRLQQQQLMDIDNQVARLVRGYVGRGRLT
jgi:hypothetical protein